MKLLVVSESPLERVGGDYYSIDTWIRLPQHFAQHAEITLWAPLRDAGTAPHPDSWRVDLGKLRVEPHDVYHSFGGYYRLWPRRVFAWRRRALRLIAEHDAVILRIPSPMVSLITASARRAGKPLVLIVVGDLLGQSDRIRASRGLRRAVYTGLSKVLAWQERRCGRHAALVYVYNEELAERHRANGRPVRRLRDPHLRLADIVHRTETCRSEEVRILRVCWLLPSKGIEHLLDSMALLTSKGRRVRLDIVGKERVPGYGETLAAHARRLGIEQAVTFSGWVPFDRMQAVYMRNDLQVISSLAEGTPRCIDEGAAHGLPLVCTSVGGCAEVLEHERTALLVPPADPQAMAAAIERVIDDGELRRTLIAHGYELARSATFDTVGKDLFDTLRSLVECAPSST
jgi:glycosyltransferase involved in cell wall biosynthesis